MADAMHQSAIRTYGYPSPWALWVYKGDTTQGLDTTTLFLRLVVQSSCMLYTLQYWSLKENYKIWHRDSPFILIDGNKVTEICQNLHPNYFKTPCHY